MKEKPILARILLERSKTGARLFRNNTGMAWQGIIKKQANGSILLMSPRPVNFGLCEGSSDLIGWTPYEIQPEDVGKKVAIFTAIEVKTKSVTSTKEQKNFIARVKADGGIAEIYKDQGMDYGEKKHF